MPGDRIEVQLDYSELLVPEGRDPTEFVFPRPVLGPALQRAARIPQKDGWGWPTRHLCRLARRHRLAFSGLEVHLETGVGIKELTSGRSACQSTVTYARSPNRGPNVKPPKAWRQETDCCG